MRLPLFQKIKVFNRHIERLVDGEEVVKEKETRLYNKLREEFKHWVLVLAANSQKGKSGDRAASAAGSYSPRPGAAPGTQSVGSQPRPVWFSG